MRERVENSWQHSWQISASQRYCLFVRLYVDDLKLFMTLYKEKPQNLAQMSYKSSLVRSKSGGFCFSVKHFIWMLDIFTSISHDSYIFVLYTPPRLYGC